jgi:regulator of protease activity HflC (stomatin/prohibitin superfamily)
MRPNKFTPEFVLSFFAAVILVLFLTAFFWPLHTVPTGNRGVVTVGGAIKGIENEGYVLLAPWQKLSLFNIRAEQADIKNAEGSTSDTQPVNVNMTVRYSIMLDRVTEVFEKYSRDGDLSSYVQTATAEAFKAVTAKYTAPDLITKRSQVSTDINAALGLKLAKYGAQVISIDMTGFAFSASYMAAINEKTTQEQLQLAAEKKLLTVVSQQKQVTAIAEAEANAARARADGNAYVTVTKAKADASAIEMNGKAIAANPSVLELKRIEVQLATAGTWNGVLPVNMYGSAPIPLLNLK